MKIFPQRKLSLVVFVRVLKVAFQELKEKSPLPNFSWRPETQEFGHFFQGIELKLKTGTASQAKEWNVCDPGVKC